MSVRKPVALDTEAKRPKVGGSEVAEQLSSPRVRASLVGGPSTGEGGGFSSAKAVAAAAAAAQRGAVDGVGSTISGLAPRCAGAQLAEVRAAFGMTPAQFAEQLRGDKPTDKNAKPLEPVTAKALNKWETGLARVPMRVCARRTVSPRRRRGNPPLAPPPAPAAISRAQSETSRRRRCTSCRSVCTPSCSVSSRRRRASRRRCSPSPRSTRDRSPWWAPTSRR